MWEQRVTEGNIDSFGNLKTFTEFNKLQNTIIPCMISHLSALQKYFQEYFPMQNPKICKICEILSATPHEDFSTAEEEHFRFINEAAI